MSFTSDDEYGDLLRRAMRAEADSVVPSPEGLDIIRDRIERRGLRGLFWWRVGASIAGAVLVAGTVVMLVPGLRTQVVESTGTSQTTAEGTELPDTSSIKRPPATTSRPLVSASASPTVKSDPCASAEPSPEIIEPEPSTSDPCETRVTSTPTPTPSASPSASPTPSACSGDSCPTADPSETDESPDPTSEDGSAE
jgi:hypothetical protein